MWSLCEQIDRKRSQVQDHVWLCTLISAVICFIKKVYQHVLEVLHMYQNGNYVSPFGLVLVQARYILRAVITYIWGSEYEVNITGISLTPGLDCLRSFLKINAVKVSEVTYHIIKVKIMNRLVSLGRYYHDYNDKSSELYIVSK